MGFWHDHQGVDVQAFHFEQVDSTMLRAAKLRMRYPDQPLVVWADTQAQGRGRLGRDWTSPTGGAWMSMVWPAMRPPGDYAPLPLVVGQAVLRTLRRELNRTQRGVVAELQLKWPNDVLLAGHKVAGVICQSLPGTEVGGADDTGRDTANDTADDAGNDTGRDMADDAGDEPACSAAERTWADHGLSSPSAPVSSATSQADAKAGPCIIIGIGINLNFAASQLPPPVQQTATTVLDQTGQRVDVSRIVQALAHRLASVLPRFERAGLDPPLRQAIEANLLGVGQTVEVMDPGNAAVAGLWRGIDDQGRLVLEQAQMRTVRVAPGPRAAVVISPHGAALPQH